MGKTRTKRNENNATIFIPIRVSTIRGYFRRSIL